MKGLVQVSSTSRDLGSLLLLGEGVGIMLDAKMLLLFLPGILVPSAEQKQSGRTHWLRSHLGAALGSSSTVQAVSSEPSLQSPGLPSQKNSCRGAILTFDSRFRLSIVRLSEIYQTLDFSIFTSVCLRISFPIKLHLKMIKVDGTLSLTIGKVVGSERRRGGFALQIKRKDSPRR